MTDPVNVPLNCRQRLVEEGKPYPRSSCAACGSMSPNWKSCDALLAAAPKAEPVSDPYKLDLEALAKEAAPLSNPQQLPEAPKVERGPFGYAYETVGGDWVMDSRDRIGGADGIPLYTRPAPASDELLEAARDCLSYLSTHWPLLTTHPSFLALENALTKHKGPQS